MARFDDVIAADLICQAELLQRLTETGDRDLCPAGKVQTAQRPVARWKIDPQTGRLVCSWILS